SRRSGGGTLMLTVYSEDHRLQDGKAELVDGKLMPCFEMPRRADMILRRVQDTGLGEVIAPRAFGKAPVLQVHDARFVNFLEEDRDLWTQSGRSYDALPLNWPIRGMGDREPEVIDGQHSYFSFDAGTPITAGTWQAASAAVNVALTGLDEIARGARAAFSLCRPPGHHAARDYYGGYC